MSTQSLHQRKAIQKYCEVQRSARSEHRSNANVVKFDCAPGTPGSEPQPFTWADSIPFLISILVVAILIGYLRVEGLL